MCWISNIPEHYHIKSTFLCDLEKHLSQNISTYLKIQKIHINHPVGKGGGGGGSTRRGPCNNDSIDQWVRKWKFFCPPSLERGSIMIISFEALIPSFSSSAFGLYKRIVWWREKNFQSHSKHPFDICSTASAWLQKTVETDLFGKFCWHLIEFENRKMLLW